jgi:hypothetical protein
MCFSATGSFGVAAVLTGIGLVSVAQKQPSTHRLMGVVPLLFAAQQIAEGVVWLTLEHPTHAWVHQLAVMAFLSFAVIVWPTWVPLSLRLAESDPRRRKILSLFLGVGALVSLYASALILRGHPSAHVAGHSVAYDYAETGPRLVLALYLPMYILPSITPFFVSTMSHARLMGVVLALALVATFVIKRETLTSVWCFFAAILSGIILLAVAADQKLALAAR